MSFYALRNLLMLIAIVGLVTGAWLTIHGYSSGFYVVIINFVFYIALRIFMKRRLP